MVKTPLTFFEMQEEPFFADAFELTQALLGETPETFDAVDMVFASNKFIRMMKDSMVLIAIGDQACQQASKIDPVAGVEI